MSALSAIREGLARLGYPPGALRRDYRFGDVLGESGGEIEVALAAFTSSPASYRSAAFGVIEGLTDDAEATISHHRSLGAPYLFLVSGDNATLWTYGPGGKPLGTVRLSTDALPNFFRRNAADWAPESIRRAKRSRRIGHEPELDLFSGLGIDELAHVTRTRLQALIRSAVGAFGPVEGGHLRPALRGLFRLLAAKVLLDRGHGAAISWKSGTVGAVLSGISGHYGLLGAVPSELEAHRWERAWDVLRRGINLANVSADDLAFVYENTFVTAETRAEFATHSTPAIVAEHVVRRIDFGRFEPATMRVYEPFCGASPLMLAAMASLRDMLPAHMPDRERHELLVSALSGDDADPFAVEVSRLSLILADWPNGNGWDVRETDLFEAGKLSDRLSRADVVLCNPPFEAFTAAERERYGLAATRETKGAVVLARILDARPAAFGIVMPRTVLQGSTYNGLRRRVEENYSDITTVSLPDKVFVAGQLESALLIAQDRRTSSQRPTWLRSEVVRDADRRAYLSTGRPSEVRTTTRGAGETRGRLWVRTLEDLWSFLDGRPKLGDLARVHRGLEWFGSQTDAISPVPMKGFARGLGNIRGSIHQFFVGQKFYLDVRKDSVRRALRHPWSRPKVVANAVRHGRGRWPLAAAVDEEGLYLSQQFFGIWPREGISPHALAAVLNGPLANAFLLDGSGLKGLKVDALEAVPMPDMGALAEVGELIDAYLDEARSLVLNDPAALASINERLHAIDDLVLRAYALPVTLEDDLKGYFKGHESERTLSHSFRHWWERDDALPEGAAAFLGFLNRTGADATPADDQRLAGLMARLDALAGESEVEIDLQAPIEDYDD